MDIAQFIAFNVALIAALVAPGPALLFAIRQSVAGGFWTGVSTGAGLGLMACLWTAAALLGLQIVFEIFPFAYSALKIIGAAYLLWIAYTLWRDAQLPVGESAKPSRKAFLGGVIVNLGNPKSVLFAASMLVVIFPAELALADKALIVLNHFVVELLAYGAFAALLSTGPARAGYLRLKPIFDRIAAFVLGALGLRLLLDRS